MARFITLSSYCCACRQSVEISLGVASSDVPTDFSQVLVQEIELHQKSMQPV